MGSQTISILTEGILASLTGGWYYDKKQHHFSNIFHLYIWLIFLCLPLVIQIFANSYLSWLIYCTFIGCSFLIIKLINAYFHRIFDTGNCIKDDAVSGDLDPTLNSPIRNDADLSENKYNEFEMTILSNSQDQNESNIASSKINDNEQNDILKSVQITTGSNNEEECLNEVKEVMPNVIDLQADVHFNDSDSSYTNLSMLFRINSSNDVTNIEEEPDSRNATNDLVKSVSNKSSLDIVSKSDTFLSNINIVYSKANSSNNSIGVVDNIKYEKMSTFRRARSELETTTHSDKYSKPTTLVPPSHPVSMEIINNSKNYSTNNEDTIPLDSSRFSKDSTEKLNQFGCILDRKISTKQTNLPQTSKDSLDEPGTSFSLEKIEEIQEKNSQPSATYIKAFDSSEDGDESEVSLCTNESSKLKTLSSRKLSKQPLRKARFSSNRKRKYPGNRTSYSDWIQKSIHDNEQRHRVKPNSIVLLSTSDEDEDNGKNAMLTRFNSANSDSSSFMPSSSSSTSSLDKERFNDCKIDNSSSLNAPSTSTGISREARKKQKSRLQANRAVKYELAQKINTFEKSSNDILNSNFRQFMSNYYRQMRQGIRMDPDGYSSMAMYQDPFLSAYSRREQQEIEASRVANYEKNSRSNSLKSTLAHNPPNVLAEILNLPGTHLASSHEDTTLGSVHVFQDERGSWFSYTFDDNSTGVAKGLCPINPFSKISNESSELLKSNALVPSNSIFYLNNSLLHNNAFNINNELSKDLAKIDNNLMSYGHSSQTPDSLNSSNPRNLFFDTVPSLFDSNFDPLRGFIDASNTSDFINSLNNHSFHRSQQQLKQSQYYELNICNLKTVKIRFDRLSLLAFLDRNITVPELVLSIILAIFVAIFSSILLYKNFFHDLSLILFCLVVASSHYTLLKSVQPDAASPTHGFNHITIYSRPIYFCIGSSILLLSNDYVNNYHIRNIAFEIYGVNIFNRELISYIFSISRLFLLSFPFLFTFGFLPQINTFMMYVFEQIDIHIFGGTSSTMGMISATYSIVRSILAVSLLYLFAYLLNIKDTQKASFSVFCGFLIAICYHISRLPSDPSLYWNVICSFFSQISHCFSRLLSNSKTNANDLENSTLPCDPENPETKDKGLVDPLPAKLNRITLTRLESDFIICIFIAISVFGVHVSSIFKLQPFVNNSTTILSIYWGLVLHYVIRQFRKQLPWLCFANPILKSSEYKRFEVKGPAKIKCFEKAQAWFWLLEKNVIFPLVFLSFITSDTPLLIKNFGPYFGTFLVVLCGVKCIRSTFNDPSNNYIIVIFTHLFFSFDYKQINGTKDNIFLLNYFIASILFHKINDFLLKLRFVITYVAPWQITWGSAFHAFAQPFSVPHSAMLLVQIFVSSILSSPLQPIFGSAIFFTSYVRPIKFWERDYNTKRVDHSNTRLASQIDKAQIGSDDNNLNSIFYEHLTRSLQHSLYGDIILGRWGDVSQGDCFVLASDNLNCLVHIIELGNGFVTFQVRGLEFRGTYCQQREVEAISESVSDDEGCCCCEPGHIRGLLSINAAFNQRWLSWEVTHTNFVLEGYSISENSASTLLQPYDLRKALITYYIKAIIYYCITYNSFSNWLENEELRESLSYLADPKFVDLDPTFNFNIDEDYDNLASGITRNSFKSIYFEWIMYCIDQGIDASKLEQIRKNEEFLISLCLGLSLLARRALGTASHHNSASMSVDFFLYGFHALFKGDFRVHCTRDEWVFQDMDFLDKVIAPSVRMALKLHQDQFTTYEEYENCQVLFHAITFYNKSIVISHEADPIWRNAILSNVPSLLALRHVFDDGTDQYKIIMLNKRFLNFRVIKINRECVRGLWAGQQQELIFLRNRNPERGSIQNAKQVLRNIINSSCDQPIGYPIYVSPLTTSFAESSEPLSHVIGPPLSISMFKRAIFGFFQKIRNRCSEVCSSNSGANDLAFNNARLSKSESSDRGIDESICGKGTLLSSHPQLTQMSNYSRYLKKKALQEKNDEEISLQNSTLVNLPLNRSVLTLFANSINVPDSSINSAAVGTNKLSTAETSFINIDQSKAVIIEKSLQHTKGDAV